jgi:hypothetical protein
MTRTWTEYEARLAVADVFQVSQQREAENPSSEDQVSGVIMFFYLIDKPGEVDIGRPYRVSEQNVNVTEGRG